MNNYTEFLPIISKDITRWETNKTNEDLFLKKKLYFSMNIVVD